LPAAERLPFWPKTINRAAVQFARRKKNKFEFSCRVKPLPATEFNRKSQKPPFEGKPNKNLLFCYLHLQLRLLSQQTEIVLITISKQKCSRVKQ